MPTQQARIERRITQQGAMAQCQIQAIHSAAQFGMFQVATTGMARKTAEFTAPEQADILHAINMAAGFATVNIISGMYRG